MKLQSLVRLCGALAGLALLTPPAFAATPSKPPQIGQAPDIFNMKLIGGNDLQGRSAYQPTIHHQGDRYIAYIGHHGGNNLNTLTGKMEPNGTSILDVTDPTKPKYLFHIPGQPGQDESGGAQMTRVCDGRTLPHGDPNKTYLLRTFGQPAHEIWDVSNPSAPSLVTRIDGLADTHKSWWECDTGVAYLVTGTPGWRSKRTTKVMDLSDPTKPVLIRDFGLVGQQPGATGPIPPDLHGGISLGPQGNRIYFAYGPGADGVLQIVDRQKLLDGPKEPTPENLLYPQVGRLDLSPLSGAHTSLPMLGMKVAEYAHDTDSTRDFVMIVGETFKNECTGPRQQVLFADITVESKPMVVSSWTVPEASGNFCSRGGRFGSHSSNESMAPVFYKKRAFISFFNGGTRVLDVSDPYHPKEVAHFIPPVTAKTAQRCITVDGKQSCKVAIQTNNIETDDRGNIFAVDRANSGLHVLRLTGAAVP
jgi:hypothetical protein